MWWRVGSAVCSNNLAIDLPLQLQSWELLWYIWPETTATFPLSWYEHPTGKQGNLTPFTPKLGFVAWVTAVWLGLTLSPSCLYPSALGRSQMCLFSGLLWYNSTSGRRGRARVEMQPPGSGGCSSQLCGKQHGSVCPNGELGAVQVLHPCVGPDVPSEPRSKCFQVSGSANPIVILSIQNHFTTNQRIKQGICDLVVMVDKPWQSIRGQLGSNCLGFPNTAPNSIVTIQPLQ